ncbi:RNA-dependent RNA polymerase [Artivirus ni]|uniref:RNA-directed RNA polymerase n=1 Tax=Drosophila melanogaster totivirus SW-2009a TaxID=663282 RepID=D0U493_9VIRU|nr:RNA-dependent RNA polymerase [Drosophila melanogaster totivirus SW-2009a]ACU32789.1 RNA-dependent RNA polymerase [Drosophila melanogaster totivirus SW-2009a]
MTHQEHKKYISFEKYVKEGYWITSGSSSIGKVNWSYDGDLGKFKARKNMLLDLYTPDEIYKMAVEWDGKLENRVFIKDELAKRRLAVASNIEAYLNQGYIFYLFGHGFKNWKYITLDETPGETHLRNCETIKALKDGCFALPFDFKGFDRQPTIWEVKQITKRVIDQIKYLVPPQDRHLFTKIAAKNISCYDNNYLYSPLTKETKKQTNGIPSGIRPTSFIGNVWNMITTDIARDQTSLILGKDNIRLIALKGDDTKILAKDFMTCLVFRYSYQAINAVGENSKFGIMQNCCEFLRTEISTQGVRGWTNRAIPSVTQRKPWNPQPWTANQQVETTANNIYLLERRSKKQLDWLHQANKIKWSKYTGQSYHWLHLPKRLGGFGIYEWKGWKTTSKLPLADIPTFDVPGLFSENINLTWKQMTDEEKTAYQQVEFSMKIAADDIPGPQKHISSNYIKNLRKLKPVWEKTVVPTYRFYKTEGPTCENNIWPRRMIQSHEAGPNGMPIFSEFIRQHQIAKKAKIEIPSLKECLAKWYPEAYKTMTEYERKGWHRTDAINIATGKVPLEPTGILNPILTPWISKIVVKSGFSFWRGRENIALHLTSVCKQAVQYIQNEGGNYMYAF